MSLSALSLSELWRGNGLRRDLMDRALTLETEAPHPIVSLRPSFHLGDWLRITDDFEGARPLLEASVRAARDEDDSSLCDALTRLAGLEISTGRWACAHQLLAECLDAADRGEQPIKRHGALDALAQLRGRQGEFDAADRAATEASVIARDQGDAAAILWSGIGVGTIWLFRG